MKRLFYLFLLPVVVAGCIGDDYLDDFVAPEIRITNAVDSLTIDSVHQFQVAYFNNVGREEAVDAVWSSSDPDVIVITPGGLATGLSLGPAELTVRYSDGTNPVEASVLVHTAENPVEVNNEPERRRGIIRTTSSYELTGGFTLEELENGSLLLSIGPDYVASTALPGLYVYLTNNPNSVANALEISEVMVFEGAHDYVLTDAGIDDYAYLLYYCKPFNVKVGDGEILAD